MDVTPLIKTGSKILQSYAGGQFKVSGEIFDGPVLVSRDAAFLWLAAQGKHSLADLSPADFNEIAALQDKPDVVLLGCGSRMQIMPAAMRAELKAMGIAVDVMDTGAACRTYNVLLAEGRRVLAALLVCE